MLGKRPRATMRRTSSVSLIGSGPVNGDSSSSARLSAYPHAKESKLKSSHNGGGGGVAAAAAAPVTAATPNAGASQPPPRLVIGFHPKVPFYEATHTTASASAHSPNSSGVGNHHRASALSGVVGAGDGLMMPPPPQSSIARKSPSGSPRSALGDLLAAAGSRPWERKDGGVGLGIVAALNSSNQNMNSSVNGSMGLEEEENDNKAGAEDNRMFAVPPTGNGGYHHHSLGGGPIPSSIFAPSRASPPIPIHQSPTAPHSDYNCPSHCTHQNCLPASAFGPVSASLRLNPILPEHEPSSFRLGGVGLGEGGGGGRPIMFSQSPANHHHPHHPPVTPRSRLVVNNTPAATITGFGLPATPWEQQQQQLQHLHLHQQQNHQMADMEVDRTDSLILGTPPLVGHAGLIRRPPGSSGILNNASNSAGFPSNFLEACYLCRRRLGEGRDIYIYRGDRAFCSPECRSQQIVNNERSEKCSSAVMKVGGGSESRTTTQRTRVMTAGTAAAA